MLVSFGWEQSLQPVGAPMGWIKSGHVLGLGLALLPVFLSGCQSFYPLPNDPVPSTSRIWVAPATEPTPDWALLPQQAKNHVYIYLLNGNDPLNTGNLLGVRDYLHQRGFVKTSYGQQFHGPWFESEIEEIHAADPLARFVLVGFSAAAGPVNQLARRLGEEGIGVDRLIYLDGVFLFRSEELVKPDNVEKFVNLQSEGWIVHGSPREGAENFTLKGAGHFDVPSHPRTLEILMREATTVAQKMPVVVTLPDPLRDNRRQTVPVTATAYRLPSEWQFLQPNFTGGVPVISHAEVYKPASTSPRR